MRFLASPISNFGRVAKRCMAPVLKFDAGCPFLYRFVSKRNVCQPLMRCRCPFLSRLVPTPIGAFGSELGSRAVPRPRSINSRVIPAPRGRQIGTGGLPSPILRLRWSRRKGSYGRARWSRRKGSYGRANQRCLNLNPAVEVVVGVRFSVH